MFDEDAIVSNPHFPATGQRWDVPIRQPDPSDRLFERPNDHFDYTDVQGSTSRPQIDISKPALPNHEKRADITMPQHNLFQSPRDTNKLVPELRYSEKYHYIQQQREPTPKDRNVFKGKVREETKSAGVHVPQIDLSKPARRAVGYQSPILSERPKLFNQPREIIKYQDLPGSHPRRSYDPNQNPKKSMESNLIPNSARLFNQPREIIKYQDLPGSHPRQCVDLSKPAKDLFVQPENDKRALFVESREIFKFADGMKAPRPPTHHKSDEVIGPDRPKLFQQPRDTMKYQDLPGSHPTQFYPTRKANPSPTYSSKIFV